MDVFRRTRGVDPNARRPRLLHQTSQDPAPNPGGLPSNLVDRFVNGDSAKKMLAELRLEREQIEEAIMTLERLTRGRGRRRGRPPAWMSQIKRRGRPPGSKNKPSSAR